MSVMHFSAIVRMRLYTFDQLPTHTPLHVDVWCTPPDEARHFGG